ncbi:hypothetical protein [Planomonospora venezuelensis]|uniref:4-amino-4-deoxy-L-arabinose transferase n=1 Tax=Planomonospora venezuelensis TaxID=1999 RepID=A0A841D647_PLAVE|nr:hypothetical protein [Planomonospora venezuelensis]MBB5963974.1 hypothetical protein [Planomonospora venezuelensis]GIN05415.1 hypothetical protein Pve01_70730 [Planomonospora venezuelensis]
MTVLVPGRRRVSPGLLLSIVALCYAAVQFSLVTTAFGIEWDEAVYISQFSGKGAPIAFHASRGWGTPLVVAPVVVFTDSIAVLRAYLMVLSSLLLFGAFRIWLPIRPGYTVPMAAALFAACWPTVFYGSEAMPNIFTALGAVALTGLVLRAVIPGVPSGRAALAVTAGLVVLVSLFRPTDTTVIVLILAGVTACTLLSPGHRRRAVGVIAALGAGLLAAWGLWTADAVRRYGGVAERMELATEYFGPYRWLAEHYLRALDGPVVCSTPDTCGPVSAGGVAWATALLLLSAIGSVTLWKRGHRLVSAAPAAVALGIAGAYLYHPLLPHPRYLLPAYGLLSIAAADGVLVVGAALRQRTRAAYAVAFCGLLAVGHLGSQAVYLLDNVGRLTPGRAQDVVVAAKVKKIGYRRPCLVYGWHAPQIGHHLGCEAAGASGGKALPATPRHVPLKAANGYSVIVVYRGDADRAASDLAAWPRHRLTSNDWYARISDGAAGPAAPPGPVGYEPGL